MKKKSIILSIFACILCLTMLAGVSAPKKKPILSNELANAEEVIEYILEESTEDMTTEENEEIQEDDDDCETCVCIIGKAKLTLAPDMATITACIEKFNEDMNASKNENLAILDSVMSLLKEQGISEDKITLDYFTAHPTYDYDSSRQPIGYYSKSSFSFEVDKIENIPTYISILTENGVTDICDVCYSVSNMEEEYSNALVQALENAKTKASKLLGSEELKICGIREESVYSCNTLCRKYVENLSSELMGNVEIEARVNVMFKM